MGKEPQPMHHIWAPLMLNPLRKLVLSPKKLAERLGLPTDAKVLEIGCGPGFYSGEIARSVPGGELTLLDIQQEMLDFAKRRLERMEVRNVTYVLGDAARLPMEGACFDAVFLVAVLGEVPDREQCLKEIHRVLRPNGLLSVSEQRGDPHFTPMEELQRLAARNGFSLEKVFSSPRNYTLNFRKSSAGSPPGE